MNASQVRRAPRVLLLGFAFACVGLQAAEESATIMREKLRAKILASAPPPPPPALSTDKNETAETDTPPILMKPVIVTDTKSIQAVTAKLERAEQERREEKFSAQGGGKIGRIAGLEVGGWWSPDGGWTFMRANKTQTYRQAEAAKERIKELEDLAKIGRSPRR